MSPRSSRRYRGRRLAARQGQVPHLKMQADGELKPQLVETTPGRLLLYEILPHHANMTFRA